VDVMPTQALVVEPDIGRRVLLLAALAGVAQVCAAPDFFTARRRLSAMRFDLLVANIRLGAHNGLHLVYLARDTGTRSVVYAEDDDLFLGRMGQAAGAFYVRCKCAPIALPGYLTGVLPPSDRRDLALVDRRCAVRGGRRSADLGHQP
jgi:hypothetical protein